MTRKEVIDIVLNCALNEIGYLEKASNRQLDDKTANAGDKNYTKYARDCFPELQGLSWCCMFIWWIFEKAYGKYKAQTILGTKTAKCSHLKEHMREVPIEEVNIGDIVFFKNESGAINHVGIVDCTLQNEIWTVEGNTTRKSDNTVISNGGGVFSRYYNIKNPRIACVCRPYYEALCDSDIIEDKDGSDAVVNAYSVNVRSGVGVEYRRVGQVNKGYKLKVLSEHKDKTNRTWYKFVYKDIYAYICADYVKKNKEK